MISIEVTVISNEVTNRIMGEKSLLKSRDNSKAAALPKSPPPKPLSTLKATT